MDIVTRGEAAIRIYLVSGGLPTLTFWKALVVEDVTRLLLIGSDLFSNIHKRRFRYENGFIQSRL